MTEDKIETLKRVNPLGYMAYEFVNDDIKLAQTAQKAEQLQQAIIDNAIKKHLISREDVPLWNIL